MIAREASASEMGVGLVFHRWLSVIDIALIDKHWTHEALLVSMQQNLSDVRKEFNAVFFTKTLFLKIIVQEHSQVKGDTEVCHVIQHHSTHR